MWGRWEDILGPTKEVEIVFGLVGNKRKEDGVILLFCNFIIPMSKRIPGLPSYFHWVPQWVEVKNLLRIFVDQNMGKTSHLAEIKKGLEEILRSGGKRAEEFDIGGKRLFYFNVGRQKDKVIVWFWDKALAYENVYYKWGQHGIKLRKY